MFVFAMKTRRIIVVKKMRGTRRRRLTTNRPRAWSSRASWTGSCPFTPSPCPALGDVFDPSPAVPYVYSKAMAGATTSTMVP